MTTQHIETDVDSDVLGAAQEALGTEGAHDTVVEALRQIVLAYRRSQVTEENFVRFAKATADLANPEVMAGAWR